MNSTRPHRMRTTWRALGAGAALAALVFSANPLAAQTVHAGLKGGASIASFWDDDAEETDWLNGYTAGGFLTFRFHRNVAFQPEFVFTQKGATASFFDEEVGTIDADARIDYFELPLLLKFMVPLGRSGASTPYAIVGPTIGFEAGCEVEGEALGVKVAFDCDEMDADVESLDYGAVFGGGWTFPVYSAQVSIDGRYVLGLSDFDASEDVAKHQSFALTLGVAFRLWEGPRTLALTR